MTNTVLDNPAWHALTGPQLPISYRPGSGLQSIRYQPGILPFVAFQNGHSNALAELTPSLQTGDIIYLIDELPDLPARWTLVDEFPCAQMVYAGPIPATDSSAEVERLGEEDHDDIYDLVQQVQPGFFARKSPELGNYFGIRSGEKLVAVAGERMRPPGFVELSAICTLPDHTGKGFAQKLIDKLCEVNLASGIKPFLHVQLKNTRALKLYQHKEFVTRREITFWKIRIK